MLNHRPPLFRKENMLFINVMTPEIHNNLRSRRWRELHSLTPEQLDRKNKYLSEWYNKNLDAQRKRSINWRKNHPVEAKLGSIKFGLKRLGWSIEAKAVALIKQDNRCAICNELFIKDGWAHCDHEHVTPPKPRGLLCNRCNVGIGMLLESPERCETAAAYLRNWRVVNAS